MENNSNLKLSYQKLKNDYMSALKAKDKARQNVLSVLIGKIDNEGKLRQPNLTLDQEHQIVTDAIRSTVKSIQKAEAEFCGKANLDYLDQLVFEYELLSSYLPKQIFGDELRTIIQQLLNNVPEGANVTGYVMKELKSKYNGCYDGREANNIINSLK